MLLRELRIDEPTGIAVAIVQVTGGHRKQSQDRGIYNKSMSEPPPSNIHMLMLIHEF